MSENKNSMWALFGRRSYAFLIDFLLVISVLAVLIRVFNAILPGHDVREDAMQLYTQKDFYVFFATSFSSLLLLSLYMLYSYRSERGQTIGHRVAGIRIRTLKGGPVGPAACARILVVTVVRSCLLLFPGPAIALMGGEVMGSIFALIWGLMLILPIPVRKTPEPISLWQLLGNYRFIAA